MPPLPSPGSIINVEFLQGDDATHEAGSRFKMSYTGGPPTAANLNTLATAVSTTWGTHIAPLVWATEALHGVVITDLSSDTGAVGEWSGTVDGTRSGTAVPANVCAVVNHQILRRYRGGRPRTYLRCGVSTDTATNNTWSDDFTGDVLSGWEAWISAILAETGIGMSLVNIVNVSFYNGNTVFTGPTGRARNIPKPRTTPIIDSIQSSSVATKIGSQRRRLDV